MSIKVTTERPGTPQGRPGVVPWLTVVPLSVVMAYAAGFWLMRLRGANHSITRAQEPFATWLRESTLSLPIFVFAVLAALTLAARWFGPVLRKPKTVAATALMVVAAGTLVGIAEIAASSASDYRLQSSFFQRSSSRHHASAPGSLVPLQRAQENFVARQQQVALKREVLAVGLGSGLLLVTNLVLVGCAVAFRGGRLDVSKTRQQAARALPQSGPGGQRHDESALHRGVAESLRDPTSALPAAATLAADSTHRSRADDLRLFLAAGLFGSAAIHAAVVPEHLTEWAAAGVFFIALTAAQLAVAVLLLTRPKPTVLLAAAVASIGPLVLWLYSRTLGLPFGPEAGGPEQVGLADLAAFVLEVSTLLLAVVLLRGGEWLRRRPPASAHVIGLAVIAVIAVTAFGLTGSGLAWLDDFGSSGSSAH